MARGRSRARRPAAPAVGPRVGPRAARPLRGVLAPRPRARSHDFIRDRRRPLRRALPGFIIIALGESIVVTGATAADQGLTAIVVLCLAVAFIEAAALWWLYFGA